MFWNRRLDELEKKIDRILIDNVIRTDKELHEKYIGKKYSYIKNGVLVSFEVTEVFINSANQIIISGGQDLGMIGNEYCVNVDNAISND